MDARVQLACAQPALRITEFKTLILGIRGARTKLKIITLLALAAGPAVLVAGHGEQVGIPQWIRGNAGLWSEGIISDAEFVSSMQYLVGAGVLKLPITEARAAGGPVDDTETAQSFVVHFSQGPFAEKVSIYSYSLYSQMSRTTQDQSLDYTKYAENVPSFALDSLISADKQPVYVAVERYLDHQHDIADFLVDVEIMSGNGEVLQTWEYEKCGIVDYWVYTNTDKTEYNFSGADRMEIRDRMVVSCFDQRLNIE